MSNKVVTALLLILTIKSSLFAQTGSLPVNKGSHFGEPRYSASHIDIKAVSDNELVILTDHPNAIVRVEAFGILVAKEHPQCFAILLEHITDTGEVGIEGGCFATTAMAGDVMIDKYMPYLAGIHSTQKSILDSMLLFSGISGKPVLRSRDQLLLMIEPQEKFYSRIRTIATEEKNKNAIVALAKYRMPQDKSFFAGLLKNTNKELPASLYAISYFPDADFLPYLEHLYKRSLKHGQSEYLTELFRTIAAYRNAQSLAFLRKVYHKHRHNGKSNYLYAILTATSESADPLYADLEAQVKISVKKSRA